MKLNLRLRRERELRGWSQAKVAEEVGTDPATVSRWERSLSFPYPHFREKLCLLFGKNAEELGLVQEDSAEPAEPAVDPTSSHHALATPLSLPLYDPAIPLPSSISVGLVGRDHLLEQLRERLCGGGSITLTALNGLPGVGKTALAVQLAHDPSVRTHFCDGLLWAALGPRPNVLGQLSRWGALLGIATSEMVNKSCAHDLAEAIRAAIGMRRMLLVIDDAWDLEDALAFKVGGPHCAFILTTRFPTLALGFTSDGATLVEELDEDDGIELLKKLAPGIDILETEVMRDLIHSVGGLPLALTLMGKYLRAQAYSQQPRRIRGAVQRLLNVQERLQLSEPYALVERHPSLEQGEKLSLQSVIAVSDQLLDEQARQALRALAVFPAKPNTFCEEAAVAVTNLPHDVLDSLTDAGLLESRGPNRYTLHQTISDYARLNLQDDEPYQRFVSYYADYVEKQAKNIALMEEESSNILEALRLASERGMQAELVGGANAFTHFWLARALYTLAEQYLLKAYVAAQQLGNAAEIATTLQHLGEVNVWLSEYERAEHYLQQGLGLARQQKNMLQISELLYELGEAMRRSGQNTQAMAYYQEGLELARRSEHYELMCLTLAPLGRYACDRGDYRRANDYLREGLSLARRLGLREPMIVLLTTLGKVGFEIGDFAQAAQYEQEAFELAQQLGLHSLMCWILVCLGANACGSGNLDKANTYLQEGLELAYRLQYHEMIALALINLIGTARKVGNYAQAEQYYREGLTAIDKLSNSWYLCALTFEWSEIHIGRNDLAVATETAHKALSYVPEGNREFALQGKYTLARLAALQENFSEARRLGQECLNEYQANGHRQGARVKTWLASLPNTDQS
ncbi:helix-turn-helix domain-containing protein [Ktedonosporobacter rubrisoli]|uniref:Helix-turn-helix domain-containing protein n=1 Tax=Ktedonosporobacter rubrisoli TaxID=2509675 RepID=A0A4P6JYC2_KTERU|nr:NB-ARC domain-containing protein [Ktedonosporobacter rubrisoli]QBD80036.1 helix-turn-helix domain-containing protein [Ktedonosporobacter rubrisoli]